MPYYPPQLTTPRLMPAGSTPPLGWWKMTETASPYVNSGSAGTGANLTPGSGIRFDQPTPFQPQPGASIITTSTQSGGMDNDANAPGFASTPNGVIEPAQLTIACWVRLRRQSQGGFFGQIVDKVYNTTSWASPFGAVTLALNNTNDGRITSGINVAGTLLGVTTSAADIIIVGEWTHLGITYDAVTLRIYMNGRLVASVARAGPLDYGNNGRWQVGGIDNTLTGSATEPTPGIMTDVRIYDFAQAASWWKSAYQIGVGVPVSGLIYP